MFGLRATLKLLSDKSGWDALCQQLATDRSPSPVLHLLAEHVKWVKFVSTLLLQQQQEGDHAVHGGDGIQALGIPQLEFIAGQQQVHYPPPPLGLLPSYVHIV